MPTSRFVRSHADVASWLAVLQQLAIPLATPQPYDLEGTPLAEYKGLDSRWHEWSAVETVTSDLAAAILDHILDAGTDDAG